MRDTNGGPVIPSSMTKTLILLSGGMDSTTLLAHYAAQGDTLHTVFVDYGTRHTRELLAAQAVAETYWARHDVLDLSGLAALMGGSVYPHKATPAATVIPNRNMVMLSVATGIAISRNCDRIATATHAGDHFIYPDCRPEFLVAFSAAVDVGMDGFYQTPDFSIEAPFVQWTKARIAQYGHELDAPLHLTWSCYKGGEQHCGTCGTCGVRRGAFREAEVPDPTTYLDAVTESATS